MTEKELQKIKERCEKATPGPWKALNIPYNGYDDPEIVTKDGTYICQTTYDMQSQSEKHNVDEDMEFIAHAREDIPKLIAEVEKLKKKVKQLRKKIRKIDEMNVTIISTMKIIPSRPKIELEDINFTDEWEKKEASE